MSMETALRTRLKDDAGVSAIVGTRIDWDERPQRSAYPAVVLEMAVDNRTQHMAGFDTFRSTRIQINCLAQTAAQKITLREAVIAAIAPPATTGGVEFLRAQDITVIPRNENTDAGFVHRDLIDLKIWHDA